MVIGRQYGNIFLLATRWFCGQSEISKKTDVNKSVRNRYRTFIKKVELDIVKGDKISASQALRMAESEMMSAVSKKIVHKNTASRKISRLSSQIKSLK